MVGRGGGVDDEGTMGIEIGCNDAEETTLLFSKLETKGSHLLNNN